MPETVFPFGSFSVNDTELGTTASENVALGSMETGLLDEPVTGVDAGHLRMAPRLRGVENHVDGVARSYRSIWSGSRGRQR